MPRVRILISGSSRLAVETFIHRSELSLDERAAEIKEADSEVTCEISGDLLERVYQALESEARKGWENPTAEGLFEFASATLPHSEDRWYPARRLRGPVEARLARKKANLPPARSLPSWFSLLLTNRIWRVDLIV